MSALADEMGLSIWPTSGWTRDGSQKAFAHQFAGDDFASLFVDTKMELAIVPVLWWPAQLPDMNRQAAAVDQNVDRPLFMALVQRHFAELRLTPRDRGVIGHIVVELQKLEQRTKGSLGLSGGPCETPCLA